MRDFGPRSALIIVVIYISLILRVKGRYSCHVLSPFDLKVLDDYVIRFRR